MNKSLRATLMASPESGLMPFWAVGCTKEWVFGANISLWQLKCEVFFKEEKSRGNKGESGGKKKEEALLLAGSILSPSFWTVNQDDLSIM